MALSALHLEHGELPSHLDFLRRHRSQALPTRFLMLSESAEELRWGIGILGIVYGGDASGDENCDAGYEPGHRKQERSSTDGKSFR